MRDAATGLNYIQARYYDPAIGRFLSIDPVGFIEGGYNPDSFTRYAYSFNDPVNYRDSDGEFAMLVTAAIGAGIGAVIETGTQLVKNGGDFGKLDNGAIAKAALVGGVIGLTKELLPWGLNGALRKAALFL